MKNIKEERDISLDLLKIMATFAVLKLHSGYYGIAGAILQYMCGFAIPIFFMVSGALLLNRSGGVTFSYVRKRIARILGLMLVWNLMVVILVIIKNKRMINPLEYFWQAMFQRGCFWHFWYLWSLVFLTALSPFIYKILESEKKCKILMMTLFVVCFIASIATVYEHGKYNIEVCFPQAFRLWSHLLYFCLGGIIYRYGRREVVADILKKHVIFVFSIMVMLSISVAFVQFCICYGTSFSSPEYCFSNMVIILYNVLLFSCVLAMTGKRIAHSYVFQAMNADSLGVYILHPFFIVIFSRIGVWNLQYSILKFLLLALASVLMVECMRRIPYINWLVRL